jgi:hypothetical protein
MKISYTKEMNTSLIYQNPWLCEYCRKEYTSQSNLIRHRKTAKFCQNIQRKFDRYLCDICQNDFSSQSNLNKHQKVIHKVKNNDQKVNTSHGTIHSLHERIANLERATCDKPLKKSDIMKIFAKKAKPISSKFVREILSTLDDEEIHETYFADSLVDVMVKSYGENLLCKDVSRCILVRKYTDGGIEIDNGGERTIVEFLNVFRQSNVFKNFCSRQIEKAKNNMISEVNLDCGAISDKQLERIFNLKYLCNAGATGEKNALTKAMKVRLGMKIQSMTWSRENTNRNQ